MLPKGGRHIETLPREAVFRSAPLATAETAIVRRDVLERVQAELYRTSKAEPEQLMREQEERITALVAGELVRECKNGNSNKAVKN